MSQYVETGIKTFTTNAAIVQHARVYLSAAGVVTISGNTAVDIGTTEKPTFAAEPVAVKLTNAPGTRRMIADGVIAANALVYGGANGKVSTTSTSSHLIGQALEAATADGDIIEVATNWNMTAVGAAD